MEDFKIVLVYDKPMYPSAIPQVLSFSTQEAAEEAILNLEKSPLRNVFDVTLSNHNGVRRTSMITDIYRLYNLF